ncbi:MAG: hypothetical protein M9941_14110 [Anaerolineae bacterium]|nr:hypothetical protein [Anaerolineae bacterium]MCO5198875.1 hypothetical protein [Anaerolineae bacterium]
MGRTIGYILIGAAVVVLIVGALIMFGAEGRSFGASMLGFGMIVIPLVLILGGFGVYMVYAGQREAEQMAHVKQQRELLSIIQTRGQANISDVVIEMNSTQDEVKHMIHDLVGKGLYSGYINWNDGILYSEQASQLRELTACRNCGGQLELAGKGVVTCPYCGTEYFL